MLDFKLKFNKNTMSICEALWPATRRDAETGCVSTLSNKRIKLKIVLVTESSMFRKTTKPQQQRFKRKNLKSAKFDFGFIKQKWNGRGSSKKF